MTIIVVVIKIFNRRLTVKSVQQNKNCSNNNSVCLSETKNCLESHILLQQKIHKT